MRGEEIALIDAVRTSPHPTACTGMTGRGEEKAGTVHPLLVWLQSIGNDRSAWRAHLNYTDPFIEVHHGQTQLSIREAPARPGEEKEEGRKTSEESCEECR